MCEVHSVGAPGVVDDRRESPPPGRLSVSSSGVEEDHHTPRGSLLGHSEQRLAGKPAEDTSNLYQESGEIEASELTPVTWSKMEEGEEEEEKEGDRREKELHEGEDKEGGMKEKQIYEEEEGKEKEITDLEEMKEEEVKEEDVKESENEAKDVVKDAVCDESERENKENERRNEMVENKLKVENVENTVTVENVKKTVKVENMENTVKVENVENTVKVENVENTVKVEKVEITLRMEKEITKEKIVEEREAEEENKYGNDEQAASSPDSPKDSEKRKPEEEKEVKKEAQVKQEERNNESMDKHENGVENKREEEVENKEVKKEKETEEHKEEKEEGADPFRPKSTKDASTTRKVIKAVNFLDSELKKQIENNLSKRSTINSTSSLSSSSSKSKEEEDEEQLAKLEGEVEEKNSRQWTLGEGNPVYRLSLKLSPNLFNTTDIPGANQHKEVEKTGFLTKLSGRSFPYIAQWKRRYCVLSKGRLYYYEREDSKAGDKSNGVIQLEYFDQVAEAGPKECKKATNVFIITSQDRSFFDPGRHLFSADTLPDMKDWIRKLQAALDQIRNNNRPAASTSPSASPSTKDGGGKRRRDEAAESKYGSKGSQQQNSSSSSNKDKKKKKEESGRGRKSSRVGVSSQTQTSMVEPMTCEVDGGRPSTVPPKGGVMLPGFSSRKDPQAMSKPAQRKGGEGEAEEDLPQAGPTLTCVTKQRVKGPQGRRAPQNRRMAAAAALKKRASSLSALEHQDATDNRSEGSDGATRSSRDSRTPEGDMKAEMESEEENDRKKLNKEALDEEKEQEIQENSPERQFKIDNIDDDLFFKAGLKDGGTELEGGSEGEGHKNRRSAGLKVNFEESPASPSKNGTLGKLFRFRDTLATTKRKKYETKEGLVADHPDMMNNSRWTCVVV